MYIYIINQKSLFDKLDSESNFKEKKIKFDIMFLMKKKLKNNPNFDIFCNNNLEININSEL